MSWRASVLSKRGQGSTGSLARERERESPSRPQRAATTLGAASAAGTSPSPAFSPRTPTPPKGREEGEEEELLSSDSEDSSIEEGEDEAEEVEQEVGQGAEKSGYLHVRVGTVNKKGQVKPGTKWAFSRFVLVGGSLHCYPKKESTEAKESITIKDTKLDKYVECRPFKHCFSLTSSTAELLFSAQGEDEWRSWTAALESAVNKPPSAPPSPTSPSSSAAAAAAGTGAKLKLAERAKRSVLAKTTTSKMGRRAIKSQAPREVTQLLNALKELVHKETGSARKANDMENNILRVGVKLYFLVSDGKVGPQQVLMADTPLRQALKVFGACHDHVYAVRYSGRIKLKQELLQTRLEEVATLVRQAGEHLTASLQPHVRPSNLQRLANTMEYFGNAQVLMRVLMDPIFEADLDTLIIAARHYAQFHFYEEDIAPMARRFTIAL